MKIYNEIYIHLKAQKISSWTNIPVTFKVIAQFLIPFIYTLYFVYLAVL